MEKIQFRYPYLIKLLQEYTAAKIGKGCKVEVIRSTNRDAQVKEFLNEIKNQSS